MIKMLGFIGAAVLPLWNIPLILRIQRRRSSKDLSLSWAVGVWLCLAAMLPSGLASPDPVYRLFTILNVILFTGVVVQVFRFRGDP